MHGQECPHHRINRSLTIRPLPFCTRGQSEGEHFIAESAPHPSLKHSWQTNNYMPIMKDNNEENVISAWENTRSGAWSVRGFHYQHLFSTLILIRQWAGLAPTGHLVPEGEEDCVVELPDHDVWIQIKSRKRGKFRENEVKSIFRDVGQKAERAGNQKTTLLAVGLEQPCSGFHEYGLDKLFDGETKRMVVCKAPETEIVNLLSRELGVAEIIAEGLASDLYKLIAESAAANASRSFERRRRISTTEIERRILNYLEANDPSAIDYAFNSGALRPVDFVTPVSEPGFYQGVKVQPGHVAAGLVLDRPNDIQNIVVDLKNRRQILITGPSGAGKSALTWLVANLLDKEFRWYRISDRAGAHHADAITRFVRARCPNRVSPIGLIFDEVGPSNSDVWNVLVHELRELPDVYLLGSVRNEDKVLIANHSDTGFFEVSLSEDVAQSVWRKLTNQSQTEWRHWREPFEQSNGLMLEYVHLLTQGKRLAAVIFEQVRQREREKRKDELAIIRGTAALCALGGEVEFRKLIELLELPSDRASVALQRLLDEHLVRESRPGVIGGLHSLRSEALSDASHDEIVFLRADSFWRVLMAATNETLPRIIQSVLKETQEKDEVAALQRLGGILAANDDIEVWSAILTGLGLGTLERRVASFISILEKHGVQRALWSAASMFALSDGGLPPSVLPEVQNAVLAFQTTSQRDLRADCLALLSQGTKSPTCTDLRHANRFLSCLVSIVGEEPIPTTFVPEIVIDAEYDIRDFAALLSTAYAVDPDMARNLALKRGGEQTLLGQYHSQTPWMTTPVVDPSGQHGRTVRADWLYVDEEHQVDPHETIVTICETLLALSPLSDAAASDAIDPSGRPIAVGDFRPWSKNIPRQNLPAKAQVAWNVAFRQILLARAAADSLTDYTRQIAQLVRSTEKAFRSFSEKWIRGKRIPKSLATEINEIRTKINRLSYATPEELSSSMTTISNGTGSENRLGALLSDVLNNLVPSIMQIAAAGNAKAPATFAGSRSAQAREHANSEIWRTTSSPPLKELTALAERLNDVACILHEIAHTSKAATTLSKTARRIGVGKVVHAVARSCHASAERRFRQRQHALEKALKARGWSAKCWTRPIDSSDSPYWPAAEVAVLVEITDFETDVTYIGDCLLVGQEQLAKDWRFRVVPVISGHVIPALALLPSSLMPLPDRDFESEWQDHIALPFLSSEKARNSEAFDSAVAACTQISAILYCRDLTNLLPEEEEVLSKAVNSFNRNQEIIGASAEEADLEEFIFASSYLNEIGSQVVSEYEAVQTGRTINSPLCMSLYNAMTGEESEKINELAAVRMLLRQAECRIATT